MAQSKPYSRPAVDDATRLLGELVYQIEISGAVDDHGHDLRMLAPVGEARRLLAKEGLEPGDFRPRQPPASTTWTEVDEISGRVPPPTAPAARP